MRKIALGVCLMVVLAMLHGCSTTCTYSYARWLRENSDSANWAKINKTVDGKERVIIMDTVLHRIIDIMPYKE